MTASAPWLRVRNPVAIPDPVTPATLAAMPDPLFAELLRGNLLPRTEARDERRTWTDLWSTLARDNALADRVFGVLGNWLDLTRAALAQEDLDEPQRKRATGFIRLVGEAWARTIREGERRRPLAWAGPAGAGFDPAGRSAIALLVSAIASHRDAISRGRDTEPRDRRLWSALRHIGLDPAAPTQGPLTPLQEDRGALDWADQGIVGRWSPQARAAAGVLVSAIAAHREAGEHDASWSDQRLWHILTVVDLDPRPS